jgi:hypothetical protein
MRNKENEPLRQSLNRKACKTWIRITGVVEKSETLVKIKLKERELQERKKKFGVGYMDLLNTNRSEEELQQYLQQSKSEVAVLSQEVAFLQTQLARIDEKITDRLRQRNRRDSAGFSPKTSFSTTSTSHQHRNDTSEKDPNIVMQSAQFPEYIADFNPIPKDPPVAPPLNPFDDVDAPQYVSTDTAIRPTAPAEGDI